MRLTSIKLSAFKSFADPTTFQLPGQLVGVVGPNGCGKSNIIDAVRWVLGESKASELRGESMQDVIFNGSNTRKPAGRASVELVFDNAAARAGGPWNAFAELAVKRILTRDGTSSYYINNQPVRRRDVQDLFLGTGLGPRAYAIIGQGTISRIIESRPEDLRLFLEEAAGVSKYKERRRETETRLKDTRDNLARVEDILRELDASLAKLEQQAEVATRYRALQAEGQQRQHELWFARHRDASADEARAKKSLAEASNALEARLAELRRVEAELEAARQSLYAAGDELHDAQGRLGDAQLEVSRLEERIRYVVEGRQRLQQRLADLTRQHDQWSDRRGRAEQDLEVVSAQIAQAADTATVLAAETAGNAARLPDLQEALRAAQAASGEQRNVVAQVQQQIHVLAAETRSIDEQLRQLDERQQRLSAERCGLAVPDEDRLAGLRQQHEAADQAQASAAARVAELSDSVPALDAARRAQAEAVQRESSRQSGLAARLNALRALQDKVIATAKLKPWLERHGLGELRGLWTRIHIEPGWETALESCLRERIHALEVGRVETVRAFAADAPPARLAFYARPAQGESAAAVGAAPAPDPVVPGADETPAAAVEGEAPLVPLADRLRLAGTEGAALKPLLDDWLAGVYTAESLDAALALRPRLTHGEVIVTREGHGVTAFAVAFYAPDSEQAGLLARAQEIEQLDRDLKAQAQVTDEARSVAIRGEAAYAEGAAQLSAAQREAADARARAHALEVETLRLTQQAEAARARAGQLDGELGEIDGRRAGLVERRNAAEARFEALDAELAATQQGHAELDSAVIEAERGLAEAREHLRASERRHQEAQFESRSLASRQAELQRAIETATQESAAASDSAGKARAELDALTDATAQAGLQDALAARVERERELAGVRDRYDGLSAETKRADEQRLQIERALDPLRERITRYQLDEQAAALVAAQFMEQLQAAGVDVAALSAHPDASALKPAALQAEIDRIAREVDALGAVNLAALEELGSSRERKSFLDEQSTDLEDAIGTLEDAIRRIDIETRELLARTFDDVNKHFGRMFPLLFGGGNAKLVMTGGEILDAGVQVMAQPPGKKNATIHLLSGGEKALTAIALVFAIFQLNPAPFCLLDEVDAPLDDANTDRYCKLVGEMSSGTQFLFISHNKIAMEMAQQLIGVTMQEQGVSRVVAVDMETAVGMAEAA